MATAGPVTAALLVGPGGAGKGRRVPGGPAAGHLPRVEPADDLSRALHRAGGERRPPVADHADLHADPPLIVDTGQTVPRRGHDGLHRGRPAAAVIGLPPEPWVQPMPCVQSAPWVEPVPGVQSGSWVQSGSCARSWCCAQSPGCIQSLFAAQSWPSASVPGAQGGASTQPHPRPQPGCPAQGPGPHPGPAGLGPQRGPSAQPSARPARTAGMSCTSSPESGFQTRWQGRPSSMRRSAASRADTVMGSACSTSQTARGAPPFRQPPSAAAGSRSAPGIHASVTTILPRGPVLWPIWLP